MPHAFLNKKEAPWKILRRFLGGKEEATLSVTLIHPFSSRILQAMDIHLSRLHKSRTVQIREIERNKVC